MTSDTPMGHACEAYGPDLPDHCFVERATSRCRDLDQCRATMAVERELLWARLLILEQLGDDLASDLLEAFGGPEDLLGGPGSTELDRPS